MVGEKIAIALIDPGKSETKAQACVNAWLPQLLFGPTWQRNNLLIHARDRGGALMLILEPPYALWSIWNQLSALQHGLIYTLCVLSLYAGLVVVFTTWRLHSIRHLGMNDPAAIRTAVVLRKRCANLHYAILAELYLFGIVLFNAFQFVAKFLIGDNVERQIIGKFVLDAAFATNVFAVLLILHVAQWLVSIRLSRYSDNLSRSWSPVP